MIYVLSDDPDGTDRLAELTKALGDIELQQLNTMVFDGQRIGLDELLNACEALPFLATRRLVVIRGLLSRSEPKGGAAGRGKAGRGAEEPKVSELLRQLEDYLPRLPATTDLVFLESARIGKKNPLHKALVTAQARFAQTAPMTTEELADWIERRVQLKGGRLASGTARLLASFGGGNLRALDGELDKLVAFAGAQPIGASAVDQLVDAARERNIFKLCDAIAEGNVRTALLQLHALLGGGDHPLPILSMVVRQFRLLYQVRDLGERGVPPAAIAARLRVQPFVVDRLSRQLRRYPSFGHLDHVYRRLLDSDVAAKTGGRDLAVSLELLIVELARPRSNPI